MADVNLCGGEKGSNSTITKGLLAHCVGWELRECSSGAAGTTIKGKPQCVSLGSARKPVRSGRHAMTSHAQHGDSGDVWRSCCRDPIRTAGVHYYSPFIS